MDLRYASAASMRLRKNVRSRSSLPGRESADGDLGFPVQQPAPVRAVFVVANIDDIAVTGSPRVSQFRRVDPGVTDMSRRSLPGLRITEGMRDRNRALEPKQGTPRVSGDERVDSN